MKKVFKILGMATTYIMAFLGGMFVLRGLQLKYPLDSADTSDDED